MSERVRFAPSPTGYLHIGGVRTALYNWLWARKMGGTFVLRIEDTDRERSTDESVKVILESMKWVGLNWDEGPEVGGPNGPYFQTQRLELYREFTEKLIAKGGAYRCYCTKAELDLARETAKAAGKPFFRYPGTCRNRTDHPDMPYVVRIKAPSGGSTGWNDLVRGRIDVPNDAQQDVVLVRNDGIPLYNFGAVVDDLTMGITLVARGEDHIVNTPVQIMLYEAFGAAIPKFAHLSMILGQDGQKLSKRHAAVGVFEYRDQGYLPDAVLNYLARLGWSHGDQEVFSKSELIEKFNWESVGKTGAKFDPKKFVFVQASHLRLLDNAKMASLTRPFMDTTSSANASDEELAMAMETVRQRAETLTTARDPANAQISKPGVAQMVDFYFTDTLTFDAKAREKFLTADHKKHLDGLSAQLETAPAWTCDALETHVTAWLTLTEQKLKDVAQPARVALTGQAQSPGLFEMMEILGREKTLARLRNAPTV